MTYLCIKCIYYLIIYSSILAWSLFIHFLLKRTDSRKKDSRQLYRYLNSISSPLFHQCLFGQQNNFHYLLHVLLFNTNEYVTESINFFDTVIEITFYAFSSAFKWRLLTPPPLLSIWKNIDKTFSFISALCGCSVARLKTISLIKIERHESASNALLYSDRSYSATNFRTQLKVINETALS